jgi:hypothetical protein
LLWLDAGTGNDTEETRGQWDLGLELTCRLLLPWRCVGGSSSSDSVRSMTTDDRFLDFGVTVLVEWLRPVLLADAESGGAGENGLGTDSTLTYVLRGGTIINWLSESESVESWDLLRLPLVLGASVFQLPSGSIETCVIPLELSVAARISCTYLQS